jgi:hypothetical protein
MVTCFNILALSGNVIALRLSWGRAVSLLELTGRSCTPSDGKKGFSLALINDIRAKREKTIFFTKTPNLK